MNQKANSYSGRHDAKELEAAAASQALVQQVCSDVISRDTASLYLSASLPQCSGCNRGTCKGRAHAMPARRPVFACRPCALASKHPSSSHSSLHTAHHPFLTPCSSSPACCFPVDIHCTAAQPEVYRLALALAQCDAATAPSSTAPSGGSRLAASALQLLSVLPTCPAAQQQLRHLLQAPDGGQQLRSLLLQQPGQAGAKPAVLMYAVQCLAALLYPQQADAGAAAADAAQEQAEGSGEGAGATAGEAPVSPEMLQRRLLLSGALEAILELATQQAEPAAAANPSIDAATHSAVLLLLLHTHEALQQQQAVAAASVAAEAAAAAARQQQAAAGGGADEISAAAAVAAATAGVAALGDATSMQVDSASPGPEPAATDGGSSAAAAAGAAPEASGAAAEAAAPQRSRSVSMEAEEGGASAGASAAAGGVAVVPAAVTAARQELEESAAVLASLAPAMSRYVLRMLCCLLRCHPEQQAADAQQAQQAGGPMAAAVSQLSSLLAVAELAEQGLQLLRQLAQHSSAAVEVATGPEAPATEAVVRRLLLHPTSSRLRQLAADWLPSYAAASPATHRWAFERIVQPLLLAEGPEGAAAGGQEQLSLCNHFIETLDYAEVGC